MITCLPCFVDPFMFLRLSSLIYTVFLTYNEDEIQNLSEYLTGVTSTDIHPFTVSRSSPVCTDS